MSLREIIQIILAEVTYVTSEEHSLIPINISHGFESKGTYGS